MWPLQCGWFQRQPTVHTQTCPSTATGRGGGESNSHMPYCCGCCLFCPWSLVAGCSANALLCAGRIACALTVLRACGWSGLECLHAKHGHQLETFRRAFESLAGSIQDCTARERCCRAASSATCRLGPHKGFVVAAISCWECCLLRQAQGCCAVVAVPHGRCLRSEAHHGPLTVRNLKHAPADVGVGSWHLQVKGIPRPPKVTNSWDCRTLKTAEIVRHMLLCWQNVHKCGAAAAV